MKNVIKFCKSHGACEDAILRLRDYEDLSHRELWERCRNDWLIWLAGRIGIDSKVFVILACDCADVVKRFLPDNFPCDTTDRVRAYLKGEISQRELLAVKDAATCVIPFAASVRISAARAVANAARAARATIYAGVDIRSSAGAAAYAMYAVDAVTYVCDTIDPTSHRRIDRIVRKHLPFETIVRMM